MCVLQVVVMSRAFVARGMELLSIERFHKLNNAYGIAVLNYVFGEFDFVWACGYDKTRKQSRIICRYPSMGLFNKLTLL